MALPRRYALAVLWLLLLGALAPAQAQTPGSCTYGTSQADLDINNVFARLYNNGSLFYGATSGNGDGYFVPKAARKSPIFASGVWIGGRVNGELRVAGARYDNYTFWPGPLDAATGRPVNPASCAAYDRMYSVTRGDIAEFEADGSISDDLGEWPVDLGAPVVDGDGDPNNYNLAGGDRPEIIGDQGIYWVMNDVGGPHTVLNTAPLGVEVQVLAFAFSRADAIGSTTFYRYRVINKSGNDITDTYLSVFSDPDLGNSADDWVGYDEELSMGYVYNADNDDEGASGYGVGPPAAGYDFFQGPIVPDGPDEGTDPDTLGATAFSYFTNQTGASGDPSTGEAKYYFMQGLWGDGTVMRAFGTGFEQTQGEVTKFAFPGDPVTGEFWSEINNNGTGTANAGADRRFLITTGPFTLANGESQDIVFGVVFAQGSTNINSVSALRAADLLAQNAYNANFNLPPPPPPPPACTEATSGSGQCFEAVELDRQVTLVWGYPPTSRNYLLRYEVADPFLAGQGAADDTYNFEGFNIYRYPTSAFETTSRELVATFDVVNGVRQVVDFVSDPASGQLQPIVTARGTDSGIQYTVTFQNLTNQTDYYYGITAYAYNGESDPKILESAATILTARPSGLSQGIQTQSAQGDSLTVVGENVNGSGAVQAVVVDPTQITGDRYEIRFARALDANGNATQSTVYSIVNTTTGEVRFDGQAYYTANGVAPPIGQNVQVIDGFSYTILQPTPGFTAFRVVQNASGPVNFGGAAAPPAITSPTTNIFPIGSASVDEGGPGTVSQQANGRTWLIHTGDNVAPLGTPALYATYEDFVNRTLRSTQGFPNRPRLAYFDYEIRFTGTSVALKAFQEPGDETMTVPFELWNIGEGTPDDPSDDYRMVPEVFDNPQIIAGDTLETGNGVFNIAGDHAVSGGSAGNFQDPFTDWVYWYNPTDTSPGQAGYLAYENGGTPDGTQVGGEVMARMVLVALNTNLNQNLTLLPEPGTIFRIETLKGIGPGSVFSINTADLQLTTPTAETQEQALERIQVVPNPYMGSSSYETGNLSRVVRFTNLPPQATTIRIYTVAGTLVKTLRKEGASRSLDWNLETENNLPVASGMYLIHFDVEGVGEQIRKFGVVQRRTAITVF